MAKHGQIVEYTHLKDYDTFPVPNTSAALITKIHPAVGTAPMKADLKVFTSTGEFIALNIPRGAVGVRGTWHPHLS